MARKRSFEGHWVARGSKYTGRITFFLLCVAIGSIISCQNRSHGANDEQGVLEIRVKDHREAIGDFSRLTLKLDKIAVSPKPGLKFWRTGWQNLTPSVDSIDLTKYAGKESVAIFKGTLGAGAFDAIQLKLKDIEGILKKNKRTTEIKNSIKAFKLAFPIKPKSSTVIVLDLEVLDVSDHPPLSYELAMKGWELYVDDKLVGKIPPG